MSRRWMIPDKYKNDNFANFIYNINDLGIEFRPIKNSWGSLDEWSDHFQLWEVNGITLEGILRFLDNKGCIEIRKKENRIRMHHNNLEALRLEIMRRIK